MSSSQARIRVLAVDDHPLIRGGIAAMIRTTPDMTLVAEAVDGLEAVECFRAHRPDVTLMDLQMPRMNGNEAINAIRGEYPDARIVVLTTYKGDAQAMAALKAGAWGFLLKDMLMSELVETVRAVHAGRRRIPPSIAMDIAEHAMEDSLSAREIEVLRLVAAGSPNKKVATRLSISEDTVKAHMKSIMEKLSAVDRTHAVTIALKRGIIEL